MPRATSFGMAAVLASVACALVCAATVMGRDGDAGEGGAAGGGGDGNFEWTNPVSGEFFDQSKWTLTSGAGVPPPSDGDIAVFNEAGNYTVTFASGGTTRSDLLQVFAGNVFFRRSSTTIGATYAMTTGQADIIVRNATLRLGAIDRPITLRAGDRTVVEQGGFIDVGHGSVLFTNQLLICSLFAPSTTGSVIVGSQAPSTLTVNGGGASIGQFGTSSLQLLNNSQGSIEGATLIGTADLFGAGGGTLNVAGGADLTMESLTVGGGTNNGGAVTLSGIGSTITQTGATALTVGGEAGSSAGQVHVDGGAIFTTGTGPTLVQPTGEVLVNFNTSGGQFILNGMLEIDGGDFAVWGAGALTLPAGTTVDVRNSGLFELVNAYSLNGNRTVNVESGSRFFMATGGAIGDGSAGTVLVDGEGTTFDTFATLSIGENGGAGHVAFTNGAIGDFTPVLELGASATPGSVGSMSIEGASEVESNHTFVLGMAPGTTSSITIDGLNSRLDVNGTQLIVGDSDAQGNAIVHLTDNGRLFTTQGISDAGVAFIRPNGLVDLAVTTTWEAGAEIILAGGELRVDGNVNLSGNSFMNLLSGVLSGVGTVRLTNTTNDTVVSSAVIEPGHDGQDDVAVLKFLDAVLELEQSGVCQMEAAGTVPEVTHDQIHVIGGPAGLAGTLKVTFLAGWTPAPGDEIVVLRADDGVFGTFDVVDLPVPMDVVYTATEVKLVGLPACAGDAVNSDSFAPPPDGQVDGADLAFLLGEWGANPESPADIVNSETFAPPPDGVVDGADLAVLLGNWGPCE